MLAFAGALAARSRATRVRRAAGASTSSRSGSRNARRPARPTGGSPSSSPGRTCRRSPCDRLRDQRGPRQHRQRRSTRRGCGAVGRLDRAWQRRSGGIRQDSRHPRRQPGLQRSGGPGLGLPPEVGRRRWSASATTPTRPELAGTHIAAAHYLESWGDARAGRRHDPADPADDPAALRRPDRDRGPGANRGEATPTRTSSSTRRSRATPAPRPRHLSEVPARRAPRQFRAYRPSVQIDSAGLSRLDGAAKPRPPGSEGRTSRSASSPTQGRRRPLRQQRLAPGVPGPDHEDQLGQRDPRSARGSRRTWDRSPARLKQVARKDLADFDKGGRTPTSSS
jgi:hypothetical protein